MVFLRIDPNDAVPLGVQIARGIRLAIAKGRLAPGERLPSARELATSLHVNFHTVRKAFGELEAEGVLEFQRGRGTFVAEARGKLRPAEIRDLVRGHLARLAEDLAGVDFDATELEALVVRELARALQHSPKQSDYIKPDSTRSLEK